jgi:hypothetical protein
MGRVLKEVLSGTLHVVNARNLILQQASAK